MAGLEEVVRSEHSKDIGPDSGPGGVVEDGQAVRVKDLKKAEDLPGADCKGELAHGWEKKCGYEDESRKEEAVTSAIDISVAVDFYLGFSEVRR